MAESISNGTRNDNYGSGVASLIGASGISLDGQSIQLPDDQSFDVQDDISSINDTSYFRGANVPQIKIVGTAHSIEEGGNNRPQSAAPIAQYFDKKNQQTRSEDARHTSGAELPLGTDVIAGSSRKTPPNMNKTSKIKISDESSGGGKQKRCFPQWISNAPRWLKCVIVFSTAMLVGAVALVTIALASALLTEENATTATVPAANGEIPANVDLGIPLGPELPPSTSTTDVKKTNEPTSAPMEDLESSTETFTVTESPEELLTTPTAAPSRFDGKAEDEKATLDDDADGDTDDMTQNSSQTVDYDSFVTTFFVTGGRYTDEVLENVSEQLKTLPVRGGTSFMVHLGDWNSPYSTQCNEQSYQDVDDLFSNSSIPVYFIPGDNDFNDCPDPEDAMSLWREYLLDYEVQHWDRPAHWDISRDDSDYPENFAFVYNDILFIGVNLVGGVVHDAGEWTSRQFANLEWIEENWLKHKGNIKAFVLFAHADPDVPSNSQFYEPFKQRVAQEYNEVPVVLVHRNLGVESWSWETEFEDIANFSVVVVAGSVWPPLMGAIDFREKEPFVFDQSTWYDQYLSYQNDQSKSKNSD